MGASDAPFVAGQPHHGGCGPQLPSPGTSGRQKQTYFGFHGNCRPLKANPSELQPARQLV